MGKEFYFGTVSRENLPRGSGRVSSEVPLTTLRSVCLGKPLVERILAEGYAPGAGPVLRASISGKGWTLEKEQVKTPSSGTFEAISVFVSEDIFKAVREREMRGKAALKPRMG